MQKKSKTEKKTRTHQKSQKYSRELFCEPRGHHEKEKSVKMDSWKLNEATVKKRKCLIWKNSYQENLDIKKDYIKKKVDGPAEKI